MQDDFIYQPPDCPIAILYADKDVLIAEKPSGLLSVPGRGVDRQDSMLTRLQREEPRVRVVHRLDMDTSGIMVFALRKKAEVSLRKQFQNRTVVKGYKAVVQGILKESKGVIDAPIGPDPTRNLRHHISSSGKTAQTKYKVLAEGDNYSILELQPITGRSHQIRVHLDYLGHPILGDRFYASPEALQRASRLLLHAETIRFIQPYSGEELSFVIPNSFPVL